MRPSITTTLILLIAAASAAVAQSPFRSTASTTSGVEYHVANHGIFGHDIESSRIGFTFPRESSKTYIFGSGLWFGAMKSQGGGDKKLTFITYNPNSGQSWATPGNVGASIDDDGLYYSGDYNRATGAYAGTGTGDAWPLWMTSADAPSTLRPGAYEPSSSLRTTGGEYVAPAFMPGVDEQFVVRYHDGDLSLYEGFSQDFGFPIGLQVQQSVYSWNAGEYESAVVLQYEIVNVSSDTLRNCVVGQASDPDLGSTTNDRVTIHRGTDGKALAGIAFTEPSNGDDGYGALAHVLLESPAVGQDGFVDNAQRTELIGAQEIHTFRNWTLDEDPANPIERYDYLSGPALEEDDVAGDKRTLLGSKPFSMAPGDTAHFAIAFAVVESPIRMARDGKSGRSLESADGSLAIDLDAITKRLISDYRTGMFESRIAAASDDEATAAGSLVIAPNPATERTSVSYTNARTSPVIVSVVSAMGERVATIDVGEQGAGAHRATIDTRDLAPGSYVVVVESGAIRSTARLNVVR